MANEPLITVTGNLVADPELRTSQNGKSWVTFRVASTPRVRDRQSGDWSDGEALYLGCRAYGTYAENIAASFTKGTNVIILGRLTQRSYEKDGQKRTSLELEVEECGPALRFSTASVSRGGAGGPAGGGYAAPPAAGPGPQYGQTPGGGYQQQPQQGGWPAQQPQAQQAWGGAPAPGPAAGGGFDDEQPF